MFLNMLERETEKIDLDRLAEEELLREARRGASRAAVGGALAWQKCPLQPTNKRFLINMIRYTVTANRLKEHRIKKFEVTKHHPEHSVHKTDSPNNSRCNRKRIRDDTHSDQHDAQNQGKHRRKASKKGS